MERVGVLVVGLALIVAAFILAPSSHHYMMMGPFYLSIIPSILAILGIALIVISAAKIYEDRKEDRVSAESGKVDVVEKLLSGDELRVFKIIQENEGITQDSLHFKTGFSPSKISMIVKKLEEKNLIYREKFGKTFKIYLSDWLKN